MERRARVLLVDDILTTGRYLQRSGPRAERRRMHSSVFVAVIARAQGSQK